MDYQLEKMVEILEKGGVVVLPTDTVWGVGALLSRPDGVRKLYEIKGRGKTKPTAILVASVDMANRYGLMSKVAWDLAKKYWPGALTLVVKAKGNMVPKLVKGGSNKVGLRMAEHEVVLKLINMLEEGLVVSSANFTGEAAAAKKGTLDERFLELVDGVVDGESGGGEASTVADVSGSEIKILREGPVKLNIK